MTELISLGLFQAVKKRLNWLGQRQEVLAQNIANADTPNYRSSDLKPYNFKELLRREDAQLNMLTSGSNHLSGRRKRIRDYSLEKSSPFETAPAGNNVILKHLHMFKIALGR